MKLMSQNGSDELTLTRAGVGEADSVIALVQARARWLEERGIPQWRLYLKKEAAAEIREHIDGKHGAEIYLARDKSGLAGAFCIEPRDVETWKERGDDGKAAYIHMLTVAIERKGCGIGPKLLRLAEEVIAARGLEFARLDCWAGNPFLVQYYPRFGYVPVAVNTDLQLSVPGGKNSLQLFEKRVRG